jgi:hypothetical protein
MCCTLNKLVSKRPKELLIHLSQNTIGCGMLTRLIRFLPLICNALRTEYEDYVLLLLLIISAILMRW